MIHHFRFRKNPAGALRKDLDARLIERLPLARVDGLDVKAVDRVGSWVSMSIWRTKPVRHGMRRCVAGLPARRL